MFHTSVLGYRAFFAHMLKIKAVCEVVGRVFLSGPKVDTAPSSRRREESAV